MPSGGKTGGEVQLCLEGIGNQAEGFSFVFHELFHVELSQSVKPSAYAPSNTPVGRLSVCEVEQSGPVRNGVTHAREP